MSSCESSRKPAPDSVDDAFSRLRHTATFRGEGLARWQQGTVLLVGAGTLGGLLGPEVVRSGARLMVCDPDVGGWENLATQRVTPGVPKAQSVVTECNGIAPGRARAHVCDVKHLGLRAFVQADVIVDTSDDPQLAVPLTRLSNAVATPLVRAALDGSGQFEFGRVLTSHGGGGHACQMCSYSAQDLFGSRPPTPCPGQSVRLAEPTRAGTPIAMVIAGLALLQLQRLVGGNDRGLALDHEIIVDMSNFHLFPGRLPRCEKCLSGHLRWELEWTGLDAASVTLGDVFRRAQRDLNRLVLLEPYAHPLCLGATCQCGAESSRVASRYAPPPLCLRCGQLMLWRTEAMLSCLTEGQARALGILESSLDSLGFPWDGALMVARGEGRGARYYVFD